MNTLKNCSTVTTIPRLHHSLFPCTHCKAACSGTYHIEAAQAGYATHSHLRALSFLCARKAGPAPRGARKKRRTPVHTCRGPRGVNSRRPPPARALSSIPPPPSSAEAVVHCSVFSAPVCPVRIRGAHSPRLGTGVLWLVAPKAPKATPAMGQTGCGRETLTPRPMPWMGLGSRDC